MRFKMNEDEVNIKRYGIETERRMNDRQVFQTAMTDPVRIKSRFEMEIWKGDLSIGESQRWVTV